MQGGETTTEVMLQEGGRTIGVWLPLALADIMMMLVGLARMWAVNGKEIELPKRSETLASWCLPMMSSSLKAAEEEDEALRLFNSVQQLAMKQKKEAKKK